MYLFKLAIENFVLISVNSFPLQRITRSALPLSSLLVPYPRVGKRSTSNAEDVA
ncbi:unnamed protein product [Angiostrongylus costaricensis]|uniref:Uncharacterized protein n=1 Tax=Angiostrongylus costaricensis TaxID=334426 RepID=A0A0R3PM25_ANGCS|nr:unnamed protein product [Angiostrongylus costaricensis]